MADEALRHRFVDGPHGQVHIACSWQHERTTERSLLLLPQWPFPAAHYRQVQCRLAPHVDSIGVDLPGFGWSPPADRPLGVEENAEMVGAVIDALGLQRPIVLARAASTAVAVELAHRWPLERLILHGPFAHTEAERRERFQRTWSALEPRADGGHLLDAWRRVKGRYPDLDDRTASECALSHLTADPGQAHAYRAVWSRDTASRLASVEVPVLAFVGRGEVLAGPFENLPANVQRVSSAALPDVADHFAATHPDEFSAFVLELLG